MPLQFVNDVIKPWDELNDILSQRFAFQPDLSDITRLAGSLAVAINHQCDLMANEKGIKTKTLRKEIHSGSTENKVIADVADMVKHRKLGDLSRHNQLSVAATFECNELNEFRFLRNFIEIIYEHGGRHDFMLLSMQAIRYLIEKLGLSVPWSGEIKESEDEYYPSAFLYYDPRYCIKMSSTRFIFLKRDSSGQLTRYNPPKVLANVRVEQTS